MAVELAVPMLPSVGAGWALVVLPLLVPVTVGLAVLRYGLFDIDLLLSRTLVYLLLSAALLVVYVGLVVAVEHRLTGETTRTGLLAVLVVALISAVRCATRCNASCGSGSGVRRRTRTVPWRR